MPRSISRGILWCSLFAVSTAVGGCQRKQTWDLASVEGTVAKDGRPMTNVQVIFLAEGGAGTQGPRASGTTDAAGHYRLRTDNGDDGAVVGKHRVVLLDPKTAKGRMGRAAGGPQPKNQRRAPEIAQRLEDQLKPAADAPQLPPRYGRFDETPLRVEVRPGPQVIDLPVP